MSDYRRMNTVITTASDEQRERERERLMWHLERNLGLVQIGEICITTAPVAWHFRNLHWQLSVTVTAWFTCGRANRQRERESNRW